MPDRPKRKPLTPQQRQLAEDNRGLVFFAVNRMVNRGHLHNLSPDDAVGEGLYALCHAARMYTPGRTAVNPNGKSVPVKFSTYAVRTIIQLVLRADSEGGIVKVPECINRALWKKYNDLPYQANALSLERAYKARMVHPLNFNVINEGKHEWVTSWLAEDGGQMVAAERALQLDAVKKALKQMPRREAFILRHRYLHKPALSLEVIATKLGVCKERVRQLEDRGLIQLIRQIKGRGKV